MSRRFFGLALSCIALSGVLTGDVSAGDGIFVTTAEDVIADDGLCSLREAIINANNNDQSGSTDCFPGNLVGTDTIYFNPALAGATITLNGSPLPVISDALTIHGPGKFDPDALTIDAGGLSRIFIAQGSGPSDFELSLSNLHLTGGATTTPQAHGGAVLADNADLSTSSVRVNNSQTSGFQSWGGGIAVLQGDITLNRSQVTYNATVGNLAGGGGLAVDGNLYMIDSTVADNHTTGSGAVGGGLLASGDATIIRSTVSGNATGGADAHGGGVMVLAGSTALANSTLSGNLVTGTGAQGAGVYASAGSVTLLHSTVAFNRNQSGGTGGIVKASVSPVHELTLFNSIVVQGDTDGAACSPLADQHIKSLATDAGCTGSGTPLTDFSLLPLADNGGSTQTHAFFAPSVMLNQADDCVNDFFIDTDQRLQPRPGAGSTACDIGAYELQGPIEAAMDVAPATLDFGQIAVGQTSPSLSATLTSTGHAVLELLPLDVPAGPFALIEDGCSAEPLATLNPGDSCTLTFAFTPDSAGNAGLTLDLQSNAPTAPHQLTLSGEGYWAGCVTNSDELQSALTAAASNDQEDVIRIAAGYYPAPAGGFVYNALTPGGDEHPLTLIGGWVAVDDHPCGALPDENPALTVLDGQGSSAVMRFFPHPHGDLTVRLLTLQNGLSFSGGGGLEVASNSSEPAYSGTIRLTHNVFAGNTAYAHAGFFVNLQPAAATARIDMTNNLVIGNHSTDNHFGAGSLWVVGAQESAPGAGIFFINNTVLDNTAGLPGSADDWGGVSIAAPAGFVRRVINNNLWNNQTSDLAMTGAGGYELLHNNIGVRSGFSPGYEAGNLSVAPVYEPCTDPCGAWLPVIDSPLVNAGLHPDAEDDWSLADFDAAGRMRVGEGTVDLGAYENVVRIFSDRFE